jgi:mono/diheme cytochrome c family protein
MKTSLEVKALRYGLLTALLSLGGTGLVAIVIQALASSILPPMSSEASFSETVVTPEMVAKGHEYYDMSCSHCHGDDASGDDDGPDLHDLRISNASIAVAIKKGIKDQMPNFAKKYNDAQIKALVSYLRTLR